jgi:hypothetical protein
MRPLLALLLSSLAFAQPGPGVLQPRRTPATINYYISTAGSDSNVCSSASKCLTLAHVLALVPQTLDNNYIVNVADGTYAEPIDTSGFLGAAARYSGGGIPSLEVLGNTTTPANVVFSGNTVCTTGDSQGSYHSGACIAGTANVKLAGLKISNGQRNGIACYGGNLEVAKVQIVLTGGAAAVSVGISALTCEIFISDDLTISGFDTNTAPTGGLGFYIAHGSVVEQYGGTVTVTGPGTGSSASADGTVCLVLEYASPGYTKTGTNTLAVSGCQIGILINDHGTFSDFVGGTVSITNGTVTPTASMGLNTSAQGTFNMANGSTLTIDHYTTCIDAVGLSLVTQGGSHTTTNCTPTVTAQSSVILLF